MTYDLMRHLADSWGLVIMFAFFLAVVAFVFRPGSRDLYKEVAQIPLKKSSED